MTEEYISRKAAKDAIFDYICGHTMSKFPSKELLMASKKGAEGAFNEIDYVPTADVVPRAMIAEIFGEIEELAKIYTFPVVKNGVVEIVKEPFWCIEPSDLADLKKKHTEADDAT